MNSKKYLWFCLFVWIEAANAVLITDLVGDKDGFGGQLDPDNETSIATGFDNREPSDPFFTDVWGLEQSTLPSPITYTHSYSLGGEPIFTAFLDLKTVGMGDDRGPWNVLFNGNLISSFGGIGSGIRGDELILYSFAVNTIFLKGTDSISLVFQDEQIEGFAIDFSELRIETTSAVPAPPAVWLFGSGLVGLIGMRKII